MTLAVSGAPSSVAAGENPADFIRILSDQGLEVIRSAATPAQKAIYFRQMLREDFYLHGISRFVLGPYWRIASQPQRREFRSLLQDHLLHFYGERFSQYGGQSFRVTGSRTDPAGVIVSSQIVRPQGPPINVTGGLAYATASTRSAMSLSMASVWRSPSAPRFRRSFNATADN